MTTAPVFLVDSSELAVGTVLMDGPEGRHAVSVRRMRAGEEITLTDGCGTGAAGTVAATHGKEQLEVTVTGVYTEPTPQPRLTLVQALPKGDRGELAVEMMTETGVDVIVPWFAARCVTRWRGERADKSLAKWRAVAREAGKQSRRTHFPHVADPVTTAQLAPRLADADLAGVLHEVGGSPLATAELPSDGEIVLVVGPEGGVAPDELATFEAAGAAPYRLGPTVLRTSTAGTTAAALLLGRTSRWA